MILRASAENYLSLKHRQELSMIATSLSDTEDSLIHRPEILREAVLPVALLYGANASGKSNFIAALRWLRSGVLSSHRRGTPEGGVPRDAFALDPEIARTPTTIDVDFVLNDVRYSYGMSSDDEVILEEWLYVFPNNRKQMLFERDKQEFNFGRALKGRNRVIADLTRPNSLFVSAAAQNDHEQLTAIQSYFRSIQFSDDVSVPGLAIDVRFREDEIDQRTIDFLGKPLTGIVSMRKIESEKTEPQIKFERTFTELMGEFSGDREVKSRKLPDKNVSVELGHRAVDGSVVFFEPGDESAGTLRLLVLAGVIFEALDRGAPLIVDELDASLHTQACEAIVALFSSDEFNPKGAQLIATTHDTNLLLSRYLRRDQIWFVEKDAMGASCLYPLSEVRTRKGDNIERGYLEGRYGAIPFSGSPEALWRRD